MQELLNKAIEASKLADKVILEVYQKGGGNVEYKDDKSPLTAADKASHEAIVSILEKTGIPILSEESKEIPYQERKSWKRLWMVDPLDGTKEFIKRNGEFTVNIALIENGAPVLGVLSIPVTGERYYGFQGNGVMKTDVGGHEHQLPKIPEVSLAQSGLRVVASRSHLSPETQAFMDKLSEPEVKSKGSSLKFMLLADGDADVYPRYAPTMEWDTAAAHAIIRELGKEPISTITGKPLTYNKENLLNDWFLVS